MIAATKKSKILPEITLRMLSGNEFAVAVSEGLELGRIVERSSGWAAISVRGHLGKFNSQSAAVAAIALKIVSENTF